MSGAPFAWTFGQRFAPDAAAPDGDPNVASTRVQGETAAVTRESGKTRATNQ